MEKGHKMMCRRSPDLFCLGSPIFVWKSKVIETFYREKEEKIMRDKDYGFWK